MMAQSGCQVSKMTGNKWKMRGIVTESYKAHEWIMMLGKNTITFFKEFMSE